MDYSGRETEKYSARFADLVQRLQGEAARDPGSYRRRVAALAVLGYVYPIGLMLVLLGAYVAFLGWIWSQAGGLFAYLFSGLMFGLLVFAGLIANALWVPLGRPHGVRLKTKDAPALFAMLEDLRRKYRGPRIHRVYMDGDANASIRQRTRFSLLGGAVNTLTVGLPLLLTLDEAQFRAVLAHEYGHISGAHGVFSAWIYRLRATWAQLDDAARWRGNWTWLLFGRFATWYCRWFPAYSFVLARQNEYEADRMSAQETSPAVAATALTSVYLVAMLVERDIWPEFWREAERAERLQLPFASLASRLSAGIDMEIARRRLSEVLCLETGVRNTHPSLADRLHAWQVEAALPPPVANSAITLLAYPQDCIAELDRYWTERTGKYWAEQKDARAKRRAAFEALRPETETTNSGAELAERAELVAHFRSEDEALDLYRRAVALEPASPKANFGMARILLRRNDEAGVAAMEAAVEGDPRLTIEGCRLLGSFFGGRGDAERSRRMLDRAERRGEEEAAAWRERETLPSSAEMLPHGLDADKTAALAAQLLTFDQVSRAWLLRRKCRRLDAEMPQYVLAVEGIYYPSGRGENEALVLPHLVNDLSFEHALYIAGVSHRPFLRVKLADWPEPPIFVGETARQATSSG